MERAHQVSVSAMFCLQVSLVFPLVWTAPARIAQQQLVAFWSPTAGGGAYVLVQIGKLFRWLDWSSPCMLISPQESFQGRQEYDTRHVEPPWPKRRAA